MNLFAGKSSTERNKMIAAIILGFVALGALYMAFGRSFSSSATTVKVSTTPPPRTGTSTSTRRVNAPSQEDQTLINTATPISYQPGNYGAPAPGRNIFAFYEPPPPCDPNRDPMRCVVPTPIKTPPTPTPTPTPPMRLEFVTPQNIYA